MSPWFDIDPLLAPTLAPARLDLHLALQPLAAAALQWVEAQPDFAHSNFGYHPGGALESRPLPGGSSARLDISSFALVFGDHTLPLAGVGLERALEWVTERGRALTERDLEALKLPEYDLPSHAVRTGEPFSTPEANALRELKRHVANAYLVLSEMAHRESEASEVRLWPHHFDVATLITIDSGGGEDARSIGVGMTPGDASYADPYYYVTPWPYPTPEKWPELSEGIWHREGWTGAVLGTGQLPRVDQLEVVRTFLTSAIAGCRTLLNA